jgi:hypothetical protein
VKAVEIPVLIRGEVVMKRITATALFTLAALVTASGAMAQDGAVRATVPFDFSVGDKVLPAGTYEVWSPWTNILELQDREKHVAMLTTTSDVSREWPKGNWLVFDRYGDRYFLSEVLCASGSINVSLRQSKAEKQARMYQAALKTTTQEFVASR